MIDFRAAFGDSEDDEPSDPESQALPSLEHSQPPQYGNSPQYSQPSPLEYADLDMRNAMLAAGGPHY